MRDIAPKEEGRVAGMRGEITRGFGQQEWLVSMGQGATHGSGLKFKTLSTEQR